VSGPTKITDPEGRTAAAPNGSLVAGRPLGVVQPADADCLYIVAWAEAESRRVKPSQANVAALVSGSLHHAVAADTF